MLGPHSCPTNRQPFLPNQNSTNINATIAAGGTATRTNAATASIKPISWPVTGHYPFRIPRI
jgi:hypothetical protein